MANEKRNEKTVDNQPVVGNAPSELDTRQPDLAKDAGESGAPHLTPNKEQLEAGADRPEFPVEPTRTLEQAPAEPEPEFRYTSIDRNSDLYKLATQDVRDAPERILLLPGDILVAAGRYRNADNLDELVDVAVGDIVPEGLRLISDQYLVQEPRRTAILDGRKLRDIRG